VGSVFAHVEHQATSPHLELIESVRCLECGTVYSKPAGGGTVAANPGCPDCSYLGWIPVSTPFERPRTSELRSAS
jgi:hypothetical protein